MSYASPHRTVSEYTVNNAPELTTDPYEVVCPLLPRHGKPNMLRTACEQRRGAAAKSEIQCACKHWPDCDSYEETKTENLQRNVRSALTNVVARALFDGKTYDDIIDQTGLSNKQISKHKRIITANPDLYPEHHCSADAPPPKMPTTGTQSVRNAVAAAAGKKIVDLFHQGFTRKQIAEKVNRCEETVSLRLRESGINKPRGKGRLRQEILLHLADHPETTRAQIQELFDCVRSTATTYMGEFKRGKRAATE